MEIIPAIDIRGGKAVRLFQGDYDRETVFNDSPADAAQRWIDAGATRLHVVDLDGAKTGEQVNIDLVERIAALSHVPVQLGGAIRTAQAAQRAINKGVDRVIVGTAALESEGFVENLCKLIGPERVIVGIDAREEYVAVRGWTKDSRIPIRDFIARIEATGVQRIAYTDITRDGTRTEPNFRQVEELMGASPLRMLVAGGVSRTEHIQRLAEMGVEGAIVGTAAYTGDIDMKAAFEQQLRQAWRPPESHTMHPSKLEPQNILNHLPIMPYHEVADIGAGEGRLAIPMAKFLHNGKVVAVDIDQDKITALRQATQTAKLSNVEASVVDEGKRLPIENDSVDGVMLSAVLHHADDPAFILTEARRILKPNGWLAVVEIHKREDVEGHPLEERLGESDANRLLADQGFRLGGRHDINNRYYLLVAKA